MIPNPIYKVLFTLSKYNVQSLLIGGQACILYGAAEFSRDTDLVVLCNQENINNIKEALKALRAERIYVPPLEKDFLQKGHACHFRCLDEEIKGIRIDIIAKMRNCDEFVKLWERRATIEVNKNEKIEVIGLRDLVLSKKTQRDKDWLMLTRLVDNDIAITENPDHDKIKWWLCECRSLQNIINLCEKYREKAIECSNRRPLLNEALTNNNEGCLALLKEEERIQRQEDKEYWDPLIKELEMLRHKKNS